MKEEEEKKVKEHIRLIEKSLLHPDLSKVEYDKDFKKYMVSSIIPTAELFKEKLNHIEYRIDEGNKNYENLKTDIDKRFEQVDKRFEQVDKRFDSMQGDMKELTNKFDDKFDKLYHLLENRDRDHRSYSFKLFMASISISIVGVLGLFLKMAGKLG